MTIEKSEDELFEDAFGEASNGSDEETSIEDESQDEELGDEDSDTGDENVDGEDEADSAAEDEGEPAPEEDSEPEPEAQPSVDDLKAELERERQRFKSFEGRYKKEREDWDARLARAAAEAARGSQHEQPKPAPAPNPQDKVLDEFYEEFPDLKEPLNILLERRLQAALGDFQQRVIAPQAQQVAQVAHSDHRARILQAYPDAFDVAVEGGPLDQWIETQSSLVAPVYRNIKANGNTEQVIALLNEFKNATVPAAQGEEINPEPTPAPVKRKKRVAAAAAVPSRSGGAPAPEPDVDDYDAAWAAAIKQVN